MTQKIDIKMVKHLLACLGEEAGEVQQIVGKSLRFGIYDYHPTSKELNIDLLRKEISDLNTIARLLAEALDDQRVCPNMENQEDVMHVNAKVEKVHRFFHKIKPAWDKVKSRGKN